MENKRQINYLMNFVKGAACICIVFMHCEFPGRFGVLVQCVSRFCVPFFFMVSGYFCYKESGTVDYVKKIKHIGMITLGSSVLYLLITFIWNGGGILPPAPSIKALGSWILFNQPYYIAGQLWFLYALLYDYIIFAIIDKLHWQKLVNVIIPVGIAAYILLAQGAHLMGKSIPNMIYRNFLIEGLPLFCLGYRLRLHRNKINVSNQWLITGFVVFTVLCPVERLLMGRDFGVNIVSFGQVITLFVLCINNPSWGEKRYLTKFGALYSLYIYVFHPAVWHLLEKAYALVHLDDNPVAVYAMPLLCLFGAALVSIGYVKMKQLLTRVKNKKVNGTAV